ncbi:cathelicidin-related antimicrobial peptide Bf-CRAMP-like [Sminthopsis crassicaudata]|uniref:cathelicidin-related antimicrobial peptide Bf-CRAMP-like n=1 Tax=Sminthopsis crassicaudata TaxID=9301 RepID=UPI003D69662D
MESLRRSLLVLYVAVTITITSTLSVQQKKKLFDEVARSLLQDTYNKESHDNFLYKILEIKHVSYETERQILRFTIQETRCLKLENRYPDQCEFKDDGLVKDCSGQISSAGFHRFVVLSCDTVAGQ